ncbi:mucosal addressin cell adhesion molecule 1 [Neopelma chrysocephalum]|uniref:mucosal addressin cell adhesion molecule 1 n=1 Tax=Neopelma chrysocephalum TaxID=114329 RepID=UPI000FCD0F16|nr:mucosal addressin cell adhesion molecule 1 [Neopelma chrysocephalum]
MEPAPVLLLLSSLWGCSGRPADRLVVTPREPLVPFGGSTELNCSLACAGGTVEWRGLDTAVGTITSFPTHSILHISQATVATEGMKICQGSCHGQHYQQTVELKVYALPDTLQLEAAPHTLRPGHPASLRCSAARVHPVSGLALTWYRGHQALEGTDFNVSETDEELYDIESTLLVDGTEVVEGVEFRCEVTLRVGQETFTRVASVVASAGATSVGSPSTAGPVTTTALPPGPSVPTHDPTTVRELDAGTTLELAAATEPSSTERAGPMAAATLSGSGTMGPGPSVGSVLACSLRIWSLPPTGTRGRALRIECHTQCAGNATVRWLRTPAALSQYREEATGGSSVLWLDHAEPWHQGHYQCVLLGHLAQAVSLELMVVDGSFSSSPAIAAGAAASLLGFIVTAVLSCRLWKRFRSRWEPS